MRPTQVPVSAHEDEPESIAPPERCFTERPVWRTVGTGWQHLHGSVQSSGASFEWHDFKPRAEFDWGRSFHPHSVEVCLNLSGTGQVAFNGSSAAFAPLTAGFYRRGDSPLHATRQAEDRHQFLTVEMSFDFVRRRLGDFAPESSANSADEAMARIAGKVMTEENLSLLFGLMRRTLKAEAEGKPAPELSAEDKACLEANAKEVQRQALEAAMRMLDEVEKEMREAVRAETRR